MVSYETAKDLHAQTRDLEQKVYNFKVNEGAPFTSRDVLGVTFQRHSRKFNPETREWTNETGLTREASPELVSALKDRMTQCWVRIGVRETQSGKIKFVRMAGFVDARKASDKALAARLEKDMKARRQFNPMSGKVMALYQRLDDFLTITELPEGSLNADTALAAENRKLRDRLAEYTAGIED